MQISFELARANRMLYEAIRQIRQHKGRTDAHEMQLPAVQSHIKARASEHQHRPMPQVDRIRPHPQPSQRCAVHDSPEPCARHCYGCDEQGSGGCQQQEAALIQAVVKLAQIQAPAHDSSQGNRADNVGCPDEPRPPLQRIRRAAPPPRRASPPSRRFQPRKRRLR